MSRASIGRIDSALGKLEAKTMQACNAPNATFIFGAKG